MRNWINTGEIRPLFAIAFGATQCKVLRSVIWLVLRTDDVVDVECRLIAGLGKQAVLAAIRGACDDEGTGSAVDQS